MSNSSPSRGALCEVTMSGLLVLELGDLLDPARMAMPESTGDDPPPVAITLPPVALDPRTPVIVGTGQFLQRPDDPADALEPVEMMVEALRRAQADTEARRSLLETADSVRVLGMLSWRYADPGALVAKRVGAEPAETVATGTGGNGPQMLMNDTCLAIARGDVRVALVAGAEAVYTRQRARAKGVHLPWTALEPVGTKPPRLLGDEKPGVNDVELARSAAIPTQIYPVFENALRAAAGEGVDAHQVRISELWARFSAVAAGNPYAWLPEARTAEEIRTVTDDNRMIGFPYPKLMNANIQTDQAAALIVCSVEAAEAAGVPRDRWVFPLAGADAHDHWWVSSRADFVSSPAIRLAGRAALELAGVSVDDVAHVDLYSCFPSAVQIAAAELGVAVDDPARSLTVTGGLTFAGGPGNDYVTHSIATTVSRLRADPGPRGLVTAVGWYLTKHAVGVYSTEPPADGFRHADPQAEVDALPQREFTSEHDGHVTIESYTAMQPG